MSSDPTMQEADTEPLADEEERFWGRSEKFTDTVEAAFQREMDGIRKRRVHKTGLTAVLMYGAFALGDRVMLPDVYQQAWMIRFLIVIPLMLLCTLKLYRVPDAALREILLASTLIVVGLSIPLIAILSSHPNAVYYDSGIPLVVLFGNLVLSQRFRFALLTSTVLMAGQALLQARFSAISGEVAFHHALLSFSSVAISLIANLRMDQDQRRAFLAHMREHALNLELNNAVQQLAKLSAEDALTHLANRREFDRRLALEWGRARRERQPLALVMIDIDLFKNYNDHYGHPAGDECLQCIAAALQAIPKRSVDLVARYGGEEFVVLLPSTGAEDAFALAERMRQAIVDLQIPHATSRVAAGVTASLGVAAGLPVDLQDPAQLVANADSALYRAKENGRNRVEAAPELPARCT